MNEEDFAWLIEFNHVYEDGTRVLKRGLDASPLIVRRFAMAPDEVVAFSNREGWGRALTAFHFHPAFPDADRRAYMREHGEGHELAVRADGSDLGGIMARWAAINIRPAALVTDAVQVAGALALWVSAANPMR